MTLTVTNSLGASASAAVDVIIGDRLADPPPTLAANPMKLSWHVANDETAPQEATLEVENAGGGSLAFDISSDQPWLTIDGAAQQSGVAAPATFTISAEPGGLPAGQVSEAIVSLQNVANPLDVLSIPVSLAKGNVFDHTGDLDADLDAVPDIADNCRAVANSDQRSGDADGAGDACDNCPAHASPNAADTDHDGRGDVCECSDQNGDGRNTVSDLVAINRAIFAPALATPLCDGNNDDLCNVNDIIAANIEIFSPGNTSTCARQPVPGRAQDLHPPARFRALHLQRSVLNLAARDAHPPASCADPNPPAGRRWKGPSGAHPVARDQRLQVVRGPDGPRLRRRHLRHRRPQRLRQVERHRRDPLGAWASRARGTCAAARWTTSSSTGTEKRAPVGMAEVILTLDNSDGRAAAPYRTSARSPVTAPPLPLGRERVPDQQDPCRLRDVPDLFLDTGVGTRGYSIIEQGHIARAGLGAPRGPAHDLRGGRRHREVPPAPQGDREQAGGAPSRTCCA